MKDIKQKLKYFLPTYIIISLLLTVTYAFAYWLIVFQLGEDKDLKIYEILIPILLPGVPVLIFLRPKFRQLIMKKKAEGYRVYNIIAWVLLTWPIFCIVYFVDIQAGGVTTFKSITGSTKKEKTWFYKIPSFEVDKRTANYDYTISEYGKKYNRSLALDIYFVAPITTKGQYYNPDFKYKYWISANYHLNRRKNTSDEEIQKEFEDFTVKSAKDFYSDKSLINIDHFEKMPDEGPKETSFNAAKKIGLNNIAPNPVFLRAETRTLSERSNYYLFLTLIGIVGNTLCFALMLLIPQFKGIPEKEDINETPRKAL